MSMNPKAARWAFFSVMFALPAAGLLRVAQSHHAWLVLSHYFGGKAGNCTLAESFEGEALSRLQLENVSLLKRSSRVAREDERYALWSTPAGEYWMPKASGSALAYDLGEQKR